MRFLEMQTAQDPFCGQGLVILHKPDVQSGCLKIPFGPGFKEVSPGIPEDFRLYLEQALY